MTARTAALILATAALVADLAGLPQPVRSAAVFAFIAFGPGMAVLPPTLRVGRPAWLTLAAAVSLALVALCSEALAIWQQWSATLLLVWLAALCAEVSLITSVVSPTSARAPARRRRIPGAHAR